MTGSGHYRLFGLTLRSELPLPELREAEGPADVSILLRAVASADPAQSGLFPDSDGAVVQARGIARYRVRNGDTILVHADPAALERDVRLHLLGSAMGAILHQRRMLPLHANAIDMSGCAIAFVGRSGAGKSTLAAAFHDRGHRLLSDDICVVTRSADGTIEAQPGIPRVRLWRDAVERSGREVEALDEAFGGIDKYVLPVGERHADAALPLAAIYVLAGGEDFAIRPLGGAAATQALIANTYRSAYVPQLGDARGHFENCMRLAHQLPMFALERPWDPARLGETVDRIAAHLQTVAT